MEENEEPKKAGPAGKTPEIEKKLKNLKLKKTS
jgi:hypothetical protein